MSSINKLKATLPSSPSFMMLDIIGNKQTFTDMPGEESEVFMPIDTNVDFENLLTQNPDFMQYLKEENEKIFKEKELVRRPLHLIPTITTRTLQKILLHKPSIDGHRPKNI